MGCVSAADADVSDTDVISDAVTADVDASTVDDVDVDTATDAVETEPDDISDQTIDDSDTADLQEQTVSDDSVSPKNTLNANALGAEPDGTFSDLNTDISRATGTFTLERNYVYNARTDGNYVDGIQINKNLVIDGQGLYTIDGNNAARLFRVGAYTVTFKNLNLINGKATITNNYNGGAIWSNSACKLTVENCNFIHNIANNTSGNRRGGAIMSSNQQSTNTIINCNFTDNYAYSGGAVYGNGMNITGSFFKNNTAGTTGGVIQATTSTITISDSEFVNNSAANGGVSYSTNTAIAINFNNCNFTNNSATTSGGVVYSAGTVTLSNSSFIGNHANTGGVVYSTNSAVFTLLHNVFENNTSVQPGSVVYEAQGGNITANFNAFVNNKDTQNNYNCSFYFVNQIPYNINYNWWGSNVYNDYCLIDGGYLPLTPKYFILKMRQTSATTIEISLNTLHDGTAVPAGGDLPLRPYLLTISPEDATIRTPTGNFSGIAVSNFTIAGNGTITAYVDNQVIPLDIYQNTRGVISLNVTIDNVTLPNKPVAIVNASFDDVYNVTVGEKTYQVTVSGGTGQVELDELPEGTYLAMLSHIDNDEFHDAYNLTTFKVSKASSTITLAANTTTPVFGSDVKVTPTVTPNDATGTIIYTVDGKNYAALEVGQDLIVTGLSAGQHSIVAKYGGNDQYEGSTSLELLINVQKATLTLSLVGDEVVYPEGGKVTLKSNVDGVYTVYIGETPYEARVSLGSGSFAVPTMDVGDYTISINVAESENYTTASATATYKVTKTDPRFSIEGDNRISYGETNTIHPSLNDDARGTITYYIDSATEGTVVSYDGTFTTPATLDAGSHTIRAEYSGDTNYNSDEASFTFTIAQAEADVTVVGDTVIYPNKATIAVTTNAANTYTITVNGQTYTRSIGKDETVEIELETMPIGVYYVSVTAPATTNYKAVDIDKAATVIVNKPTLNLTVYNTTISYGETANVRITLKDGETGLTMQGLMVAVGGTYYSVDITAGEGTLPLENLNAGTYNVVAICAYDANYDVAYSTGKVTVNKATPTITIVANAIEYGEDAEITVKLDGVNNEKLTGVVKVTVNEKTYDVAVTDGVGTLTISGLAANVEGYPITASYGGNENYEAATYSGDAKQVVNKADATITVSADATNIKYGESITLSSVVSPDDATGDVTYYVDNVESGTTVSRLTVGTHTVYAKYGGNDNYNEATSEAITITVAKADATVTVSADKTEIKYGETVTLTTGLLPADATGDVTIYVDGGEAGTTLSGLSVGSHTVVAKYAGDDNYTAAESEALTITVAKADATVTVDANANELAYGGTFTFTSEVTPEGATGDVVYYVDGTAITGDSISTLAVGEHTVVAKYAGDNNYNAAESAAKTITVTKATPEITITSEPVTYPEDAIVNIKLTGVNNAALPGATVRVTIKGVTYAVVTNASGEAALTIKGLDAGEYGIEAVSVADESYNAATYTGTTKVVVNKADATVTVSADATNIKYGESITLSSVVSPAGATGAVTYYVDNVESGTTVSGLTVGTHTVYAKYGGNDNYNEATSEAITITVGQGDATVTVSADKTEIKYGETVTLTTGLLPADATGDVTIYVDGGEAGTTLSGLSVGSHTVVAKYAGDDNYTAAESETLTITVAKADVEIVVVPSATTIDYGGSVDLDYTITPATGAESDDVAFIVDGQGIEGTTVSGLSVGEHTVVAQYAGDNNYNGAVSEPVTIVVNKATPVITITGTTVTYPNNATVSIEVTAGGQPVSQCTVVVKVNGSSYAAITGNDGKATITAVGLPAGEHAISAETMPNEHYKEAVYTGDAKVVVSKGNAAITVSVPSDGLVVGHEIVFSSELTPADATGYILYYVDDVLVEGNSMVFNTPRDHTVVAKYLGNDNYNGAESDSLAFTIAKADPIVTIAANSTLINYGESVQLTVTVSPELPITNVVILVDDNPVEGFVLDDLSAGDHTVVAKYVGDDEYNEAESNPITITVKKVTPTITVTGVTVTYPADATVSVKVTYGGAPIEGINTHVKIGQNAYALVTDANGEGSVTIGGLSAGEYPLTAQTIENDNYTNASYSGDAKIVVEKADIIVTSADATATYPETGKVTITASVAGVYTVHVGDESVIATVESDGGSATVEIPKMDANTDGYDISVTAPASYNHNAVDTGAINKYIVNKGTVHVHADDVTVVYPNTKDMIITASAAGNYSIMIGRWVWDITIETDGGSATVNPGKQFPQRYEVFVRSNETKNYNAIEDFTPIANYTIIHADVSIEVIPNATNIIAGESISLNYLITPETGAESDDVSYLVDGQAIEGDTLSNLAIGTHTIVAYYAGSEAYNPATSAPVIITVGKLSTEIEGQDITVYATVGKTVEFTLKDSNGNILAGKTLTVAFNGETKNITTDENGVAKLDINMANKGTYSISASFAGDDSYESSYAAFNVVVKAKATKLTVSDTSFSLSGSKYVTAKLTAGGEPLANKIVTFSLNGKTYTGRTNSDGVVKVAVALTAKKTYSVVVSFNGDTTYGSAVATYKLKVTS